MAESADMVFANAELVKTYAQFRPCPPEALINRVLSFLKEKPGPLNLCIDVGCGSGQNTKLFAPHFTKVLGVDVSSPQLSAARDSCTHANVTFQESPAEQLPASDSSVDLITCCAAVHWFDFPKFYAEVDRVLRPGGVLACYGYLGCTPIYDGNRYRDLFIEVWESLAPYWPAGHKHLISDYSELPSCYQEDVMHWARDSGFVVEFRNDSLNGVIGYVRSWSAFEKFLKTEGEEAAKNFLEKTRKRLTQAMGVDDREDIDLTRQYHYFLRMWRKPIV